VHPRGLDGRKFAESPRNNLAQSNARSDTMAAIYSNLLTTGKRFDASAKGEQPFGATRTPRLYGVGERTFLPIWFLPLRTPFSVKPFFCRHPLKLLRNTSHALYLSREQLFAFSAIFRRRLFSSVLPHPSKQGLDLPSHVQQICTKPNCQTGQIADYAPTLLTKSNKCAIITSNNKRTNVPCGPCALRFC